MTFRKAAWLNPLCCARQFDASSDDGLGVSVIVTADFPSGVVVEQVYSFATRGVRHAIVRTVALMSSPHVLGEARISGYAESAGTPSQVACQRAQECRSWPVTVNIANGQGVRKRGGQLKMPPSRKLGATLLHSGGFAASTFSLALTDEPGSCFLA